MGRRGVSGLGQDGGGEQCVALAVITQVCEWGCVGWGEGRGVRRKEKWGARDDDGDVKGQQRVALAVHGILYG